MDDPRHLGGGQRVDHLTAGAGARRIEHRDIGAALLGRQRAPHRVGDDRHPRQVGQRAAGRTRRTTGGVDGQHAPVRPDLLGQGRGEYPGTAVQVPRRHARLQPGPAGHQPAVEGGRTTMGLPERRHRQHPLPSADALYRLVVTLDDAGGVLRAGGAGALTPGGLGPGLHDVPATVGVQHHMHVRARCPTHLGQAVGQLGGQLSAVEVGDQFGAVIAMESGPAVGGGVQPYAGPPAADLTGIDRFGGRRLVAQLVVPAESTQPRQLVGHHRALEPPRRHRVRRTPDRSTRHRPPRRSGTTRATRSGEASTDLDNLCMPI